MKYAKLVFKNILRNKLRTLLTLSSLVVSLFLIVTLGTIVTEFDRNADRVKPIAVDVASCCVTRVRNANGSRRTH